MPSSSERAERERLGERPVDVVVVELRAPVRRGCARASGAASKPSGNVDERVDDLLERLARHAGVDGDGCRLGTSSCSNQARAAGSLRLRLVERVFEPGAEVFERLLGLLRA